MGLKSTTAADVRHPAILASMLTAVAGYLDAVGFSEMNNIFVSFMSGNTTRFGVSLIGGDFVLAFTALTVILSFVLGAIAGGYATDRASRPLLAVLAGELALLIAAATLIQLGLGRVGLCLLAAAMGLQNASFQSVKGATVGKTFMTGTLVSFGQGIGRRLSRGASDDGTWAYGVSWLTFAGSVIVGAVAWSRLGAEMSIAIAVGLIAILFALNLTRRL